jgi:CheY-like chemotaxis protein
MDLNLRLDAIGEVLSRTLDSQIAVRLDLDPNLWRAEVDPAELETAVLNAAFNARDAMPQGGRLTIATSNLAAADGDCVCISISDNGEGMEEEVLDRVFEPFFTTKAVGKGTGLGLSQIHGFAAQSGGRAEIDSQPGEGTTVRILLPRSEKPLAAMGKIGPAPEVRPGLKVLLVEDNPHVLAFAEQLLGDLDCDVAAFDSPERAPEKVERGEHFDLLFSDVVMPGMSGIELAEEIRATLADLPVVLATGYSDEVLTGAGRQFEMLRKPYDSRSLGAALLAAIERTDRASAAVCS